MLDLISHGDGSTPEKKKQRLTGLPNRALHRSKQKRENVIVKWKLFLKLAPRRNATFA